MDLGTISSRYARALFSLAKEKNEETRVYDDIKMLKQSFLLVPELKETLQNPIVSAADKEKLLIHAGGIEVCELYRRFIHMVLSHKRESCLPFITYIFIYLYRKEKKITRIRFSAATPIQENTQKHLIEKLQQETGNIIEFSGEVKPELIGGFCLQIGNYRLDASYTSQLKHIREQLLQRK